MDIRIENERKREKKSKTVENMKLKCVFCQIFIDDTYKSEKTMKKTIIKFLFLMNIKTILNKRYTIVLAPIEIVPVCVNG